jgi:hypothetical protein
MNGEASFVFSVFEPVLGARAKVGKA